MLRDVFDQIAVVGTEPGHGVRDRVGKVHRLERVRRDRRGASAPVTLAGGVAERGNATTATHLGLLERDRNEVPAALLLGAEAQLHADKGVDCGRDERLDVAAVGVEEVRLLDQVGGHALPEVVVVRPREVAAPAELRGLDADELGGERVADNGVPVGHRIAPRPAFGLPNQSSGTRRKRCRDSSSWKNTGAPVTGR